MHESNRRCAGFTLIELMIAVVIIGLASAMAVPLYQEALENSHRSALKADCYQLYNALMTYQFDNDKFPSEAEFDTRTLVPLSTDGYFNATDTFTDKLRNQGLLIYLAPDVGGADTQFLLVGQSEMDPTTILAVAYTNIVSDADGWLDGVYVITPDDLKSADDDLGGDEKIPPPPEKELPTS